jgi:CRISPR/Cas system-associated endonuclease/helicase Cas3
MDYDQNQQANRCHSFTLSEKLAGCKTKCPALQNHVARYSQFKSELGHETKRQQAPSFG